MPIFQNSSKSLAKKESHSGQDLDSCVYRLGLSYFGDSLGFFSLGRLTAISASGPGPRAGGSERSASPDRGRGEKRRKAR